MEIDFLKCVKRVCNILTDGGNKSSADPIYLAIREEAVKISKLMQLL